MKRSIDEILYILNNDKNLKAIIYDDLGKCLDVKGELPWKRGHTGWKTSDDAYLELYLEEKYEISVPMRFRETLEGFYCAHRSYHPIKKYLEGLQWDGIQRLETVLIDYLGAENEKYVREVTKKTLVAAIARVYQPGIKYDNMLVLCGPQGIGKSTIWKRLAKDWYSNAMAISDMKDKTAAEKLQGVWFVEISELAGIKKTDVEVVKSFLSRTDDRYRPPYAQYVESHPRKGIIVGTTNSKNGFLRDITGNRRFWPVITNGEGKKSVWDMDEATVDQIWAEAFEVYLAGEKLFLGEEIEGAAYKVQQEMMEEDVRQGIVEEYLERDLPKEWMKLNLAEKRRFLDFEMEIANSDEYSKRKRVCLLEIWCECFKKERQDMKKSDAYELESILYQIGGWELYSGNSSGKMRIPGYGVQRTFVRQKKDEVSYEVLSASVSE